MNIRPSLVALLVAAWLPALAAPEVTAGSGENSTSPHAIPVGKARAQVAQELADRKQNPATSDGWKEVGGELGRVYVGTDQSARRMPAMTLPGGEAPNGSQQDSGALTASGAGLSRSGHMSSASHRSHR